jgi:hypothetical protein
MVYYYTLVKHLLNEISLVCTGFKPMYERDHLTKSIREAHEALPTQCCHQRQEVNICLQPITECLNSPLKEWFRKAEARCEQWGNFNANSYVNFLKRQGIHKVSV